MDRRLWENMKVNLIFYRRNNLLLIMLLLVLGVEGMSLIPSLIFNTSTVKFYLIQTLFSQLDGMAMVISAVLGLLTVSYHLRNRCLKMVVTRPCPPDIWLLAVFLSAILVTAAIYLVVFLAAAFLFVVWQVPFQWGLPFLTLMGFFRAVTVMAYLTMLATLMHPILAIMVAALFQDFMFQQLMTLVMAGAATASGAMHQFLFQLLHGALYVVYLVLPSYGMFSHQLGNVHTTYRVSGTAWQALSLTFAYTAILTTFFYLVAVWALRRKRLI